MTTKAITDKRDADDLDLGKSIRETAPSLLQADMPTVARGIGLVGLLFFVLGVVSVGFEAGGQPRLVGGGVGIVLGFIGLIGLLYHAGRETDAGMRRIYGVAGGGLGLALAIGLALYPAEVGTPMAPQSLMGGKFLPWGLAGLVLALVFVLPATRAETDDGYRKIFVALVGVVGTVAAGVGLVGGLISSGFFLPHGLLLSLVGLGYLWAFISLIGSESDLGHRAALVIAVAGLLALAVALVRSLLTRFGWFGVQIQVAYLTSVGILLMAVGLLYAVAGLAMVSERPFFILLRRELAAFAYSPLMYFILFGFGVMAWIRHWMFVAEISQQPVLEPIVGGYFLSIMPVIFFILMVPMLTMRLLSEEGRTGTLEMLMTVPLEETPVVLSKFFAVLIVFMLSWLPFGVYLIALQMGASQTMDYRPLISFTIALLCYSANVLAMGLFCSSLTLSQLAAFVLTALGMILLTATWWIRSFPQIGETGQTVMTYLSYIDLWWSTLQGQLHLGNVVLNLGLTVVWLFATVKVLESRKWL